MAEVELTSNPPHEHVITVTSTSEDEPMTEVESTTNPPHEHVITVTSTPDHETISEVESTSNPPHEDVITVTSTPKHDWTSRMERRFSRPPALLKHTAGAKSCCIFRVPRNLAEINKKYYQPYVVSIGPYHHGHEHYKMFEEHKARYFSAMVKRRGVGINNYFEAIAERENEIRNCYSELIKYTSSDFVEMIVLDGCFVIEMFRMSNGLIKVKPDDPMFNLAWVFPSVMRDFLQLENQIPFFVLELLFDLSRTTADDGYSLVKLALDFFNYAMQRPLESLRLGYNADQVKHLLNLLRLSVVQFAQCPSEGSRQDTDSAFLAVIPSATKLRIAGVKIRPCKRDNLLDISFNYKAGVLEMPTLVLDDFITTFFFNCVVFEQCYFFCSRHITSYVTFVGYLANRETDAEFLSDRKVIENYLGTDGEIAGLFNALGKEISFDIGTCYLSRVYEDVNRYYRNKWHKRWAGCMHSYFRSPWSFMSASAAVVALIFTAIQAFFAIYAYVFPTN